MILSLGSACARQPISDRALTYDYINNACLIDIVENETPIDSDAYRCLKNINDRIDEENAAQYELEN